MKNKQPMNYNYNQMKALTYSFLLISMLLLSVFVCPSTLHAQQIPLYTQYNVNPFTINPAYAGTQRGHEFRGSYRTQWVAFPTAPRTFMASYVGGFKRAGVGLLAFNDAAGSISRTGFLGSYAYHVPLFSDFRMGIGLSIKYLQYRLSTQDIEDKLALDPAIQSAVNGRGRYDGTLGFYFYNDDFYLGFSAPNLIQTRFDEEGISDSNLSDITKHYFGLIGYDYQLNELINIEPSILVRKVQAAPFQIEGNLKVWLLNKQLMVGGSYRTSEKTMVAMSGFTFGEDFTIYYSYEFSNNGLSNYNYGSHELTFAYDIRPKSKPVSIKKR